MSSIIRKKLFSQNTGTGGGGGSTPTTQIIRYNVLNYSALSTLTPNTGEFAYVQNEQGTKWLPGTIGGTYYASGLYYYTGTTWINDLTSIAAQLALNDTAILDLQTNKVPYSGATTNVNLGEYGITTGQLNLDLSPTGTAVVGTTRWNNTNGLTETTLLGGNVVLKNGTDLVGRVVNNTSTNLTRAAYKVVKVTGAQGQRLAVGFAQANTDNDSADTLGVVIEDINNNQEGFIMTVGQLEEINATGSLQGETWVDGSTLYLSPTIPGGITNIKPNGSTGHIVVIGYVVHSHAIHGKIYVKIMNGWELDELHDVYIPTYINNGTLYRDTATNLWKTATIPTILGYTPVNPTTTISTTSPLSGGGDLSANRTLSIAQSNTTTNGYLSGTDWTTFNNKIGGSGTLSFVPRFTGASTIGNGVIQDNGTNLGVGIAPSTPYKLRVKTSTASQYAIYGEGLGQGFSGVAGIASGAGALQNVGVYGSSTNSTTLNIGIQGEIDNPISVNIGGLFSATSGSANYSLQLQDGSESVGRFLKCITADGKVNWANITSSDVSGGIGGSGTANYVSKFTASGTIANSFIQEGTLGNISVNTTPDSGVQFLVNSTTSPDAGRFVNSNISTQSTAIRATSNGVNTFNNVGGVFSAVNGANNYAIQLYDGTQAVGKYLKCVGNNGEANWAAPATDLGLVYAISTGNILL